MSRKALVPLMALTLIIGYGEISSAASGKGKEGTARSESQASNSASSSARDSRLRAKFEDESDPALADADLAPEFHADYRIKKDVPELKVRVENIEIGTVVDVYIENLKIGSATVEEDGEGTEAALDFRKGEWPAGLPTALTAGMVVRIMEGATLLFEAPFAAK